MSATITTKLTDNSKEWAAQLKKQFLDAGGSAADFELHLEALNKELASREAKRFTEDIKHLADSIDGTASKSAMNWTELASKVNLVTSSFKWAVEGGKKAWQAIQYLADQGVPAFERLQAAGTRAFDKITEAASDPRLAKGFDMLASGMDNLVVPAISNATDVAGNFVDMLATMYEGMQRLAGVDVSGIAQAAKDLNIAQHEEGIRAEREKQRWDQIARNTKEATALRRQLDEADSKRAEAAHLDEIQNIHDIEKELADARKSFERSRRDMMQADGEARDKAKRETEKQFRMIEALEAKRQQTLEENHAREIKRLEDEFNKFSELYDIRRKKEADAIAAGIEGERALFLAREARREAENAAEQEKVDQLKQFVQQQGGGGGQQAGGPGPDFMGKLKGGIKGRDVQKQIIKKREEDAINAWREEQRATGKMDQNNQLIGEENVDDMLMGRGLDNSPRALAARTRARENAIRRQAKMGAFKDARKGRIGNEEIAQAEGELLQQAGEKLISGNKLGQTQVNTTRQLVDEAKRTRQQEARMTDQLMQMQAELDQLRGRGNNAQQRAQRQF